MKPLKPLKPLRLFFAIWPPDAVRKTLWHSLAPLRETLPAVRWVPPERLHITLRFMGDVSAGLLPRLVSAAEALHQVAPFDIELAGTGTFPGRGPPRIYWVGVRSRPLPGLRASLDRALAREGLDHEGRIFRPHLTVGRANRGRSGRGGLTRGETATTPDLAFTVAAIHLVRSDLRPGGPSYTNVHRAILGTGDPRTSPASPAERSADALPRAATGE